MKALRSAVDPIPLGVSGVYSIVNHENGKMYIGSSRDLRVRRYIHVAHLKSHKHCCPVLQSEFLLNPESFEFVPIEIVDEKDKRLDREQFWVKFFKTYKPENGYNSSNTGTLKGRKLSRIHRTHISLSLKGRPVVRNAEWNKKLGMSHIGQRNKSQMRAVIQKDIHGTRIASFESVADAARSLGSVKQVTNIVRTLKGHRKTALGYRWEYVA